MSGNVPVCLDLRSCSYTHASTHARMSVKYPKLSSLIISDCPSLLSFHSLRKFSERPLIPGREALNKTGSSEVH